MLAPAGWVAGIAAQRQGNRWCRMHATLRIIQRRLSLFGRFLSACRSGLSGRRLARVGGFLAAAAALSASAAALACGPLP